MSKINTDQIEQLGKLLDDGVITQEEYNEKIAKMAKSEHEPKAESQKTVDETDKTIKESTKKSYAVSIVIGVVCLFIGLAISPLLFGSDSGSDSGSDYDTSDMENAYYGCRDALSSFYLDNAVIVYENGDGHYHRYHCTETPTSKTSYGEYSFWVYNKEAAEDEGYTKCPVCFGMNVTDYIDDVIVH